MYSNILDGRLFKQLVISGAINLKKNAEIVNSLNVFPVPDGDTGTNMCMTIESGINIIKDNDSNNIADISKELAKGMLLGARGNSGVILSQIFKGLSIGLTDYEEVTALELTEAFESAVSQSYHAVVRPVEGTILTVLREAVEGSKRGLNTNSTIVDYFKKHLDQAEKSLQKTKEILPVLKEADVIDSGGAGYVAIIQGMLSYLLGEDLGKYEFSHIVKQQASTSSFNADSELDFGYCTEFILQLQNAKVDIPNFDINTIITYLETIGDSIVAIKDESLVKVHVHTKNPGDVLNFGRKFGEFVTIKIENMALQHNEILESKQQEPIRQHKKYGIVAVASGEGIIKQFKDFGVDEIVNGGQTMNPSANDFIEAYKKIDAEYIFVLPNNKNIYLAAKLSQSLYFDSKIIIIQTKTLAEGYSALTMLDFDNEEPNQIEECLNESAKNVFTGLITYSIRDSIVENRPVKKGEFVGISGENHLLSVSNNHLDCAKEFLDSYLTNGYYDVITIIYGKDIIASEANSLVAYLNEKYPNIEVGLVNGMQDIYSYIIGIE